MYKVVNFQTGELLAKEEHISFVKQQVNIDFPIGCETLEEADGIVIYIDGVERTLGIEGRNMQNYTPTVIVEKMSDEAVKLEELSAKVEAVDGKVNAIYDVQTQDVVSKADLDAAYREGVNAVV